MSAPGWYKDPAAPETQRYWDGEQWLGEPLPVDATPPEGPPPSAPAPALQPEPEPLVPTDVLPAPEPPGTPVGMPPGIPPGPPAGVPGAPAAWPYPMLVVGRMVPTFNGNPVAPLMPRLVARLFDIGAVLLLNAVVNGWFIVQYVREIWPAIQAAMAGSTTNLDVSNRAVNLNYAITFISLALWFAYEVPAHANDGQTLGKRLLRLKVVRVDGNRLTFGGAFRRWALMSLPNLFWPCGVPLQVADALWCTWDRPLSQCVHDKSARTVVVHIGHTVVSGGTDGTAEENADRDADAPTSTDRR